MSHFIFRLTPLTPLHIGSGDTLEPYEYVIVDDRLYQFDPDDLLAKLTQKEQDDFISLVATSPGELQRFLRKRKELIACFDPSPIPVAFDALDRYNKQLDNPKADLTVYPFIRTSRKPFIPGSSLKGAIRTALLYDRAFLHRGRRPIEETKAQRLEQSAFQYRQATDDPFKSLKIGDSPPLDGVTRLELVRVYTPRREEGQIPMFREVTLSLFSSKFEQKIALSVQIVEEFRLYDKNFMKLDMASIVTACRQFYLEHMQRERDYFRSTNLLQTSSYYEKLLKLVEGSSGKDSFPVRLGWGSGFDAVTVNYAAIKPRVTRSRRLAENRIPLGWAIVEVESAS